MIQHENGRLRSWQSFTLGEGYRMTVAEMPVGGCRDHHCHDPEETGTILLEYLGCERETGSSSIVDVDLVAYFNQ